jgi:hypothetical protein
MLKSSSSIISASQIATPITLPGDVTLSTGNLVIGTSGKGIDFSATPGTGTSELLADYEEGEWTATMIDGVTPIITLTGVYTKIGRNVSVSLAVSVTANGTGLLGNFSISGLPFVVNASSIGTTLISARNATVAIRGSATQGGSTVNFFTTSSETQATTSQVLTSANQSQRVYFQLTYSV